MIDEKAIWWGRDTSTDEMSQWLTTVRASRSRAELVASILEHLPRRFSVRCCSVVLRRSTGTSEYEGVGLPPAFWREWSDRWRDQDAVFKTVLAGHAATHNLLTYSEAGWQNAPIRRDFLSKFGIYSYLSAPLHGSTGLLGGLINLFRTTDERCFDEKDLTAIGVRAAYFSAALARLERDAHRPPIDLAPREFEVAKLAAAGFDNAQISKRLGIARDTVKKTLGRVYEKLQVNGRAQMTAQLVRRGVVS